MIARHHCRRTASQRGFTLVEVMLTLAIMALMAAMVWPTLGEPFAAIRLKKAAQKVRVQWRSARVMAMDSGQIHIFRYAINGNKFEVKARAESQAQVGAFGDMDFSDVATGSTAAASDTMQSAEKGTLPDNITFVSSETESDRRSQLFELQTDNVGGAESLAENWSPSIYFYPDGTTSTARLMLKNEYNLHLELTMRGMTGVVQLGEPQTINTDNPYASPIH